MHTVYVHLLQTQLQAQVMLDSGQLSIDPLGRNMNDFLQVVEEASPHVALLQLAGYIAKVKVSCPFILFPSSSGQEHKPDVLPHTSVVSLCALGVTRGEELCEPVFSARFSEPTPLLTSRNRSNTRAADLASLIVQFVYEQGPTFDRVDHCHPHYTPLAGTSAEIHHEGVHY